MKVPFKSEAPFVWLWYCAEILGGPKLDREVAEVYFRAVGSDDADAIVNALGNWLRTERRFPLPADIRAVLGFGSQAPQETEHA